MYIVCKSVIFVASNLKIFKFEIFCHVLSDVLEAQYCFYIWKLKWLSIFYWLENHLNFYMVLKDDSFQSKLVHKCIDKFCGDVTWKSVLP